MTNTMEASGPPDVEAPVRGLSDVAEKVLAAVRGGTSDIRTIEYQLSHAMEPKLAYAMTVSVRRAMAELAGAGLVTMVRLGEYRPADPKD